MLGSSGPQGSCSNANTPCSSSFKSLCILCTRVASHGALSIFAFRAVRKTRSTVPRQSVPPCLANRNSPPVMPFQCYLATGHCLPVLHQSPRREDCGHMVHILCSGHRLPPGGGASGSSTRFISCRLFFCGSSGSSTGWAAG